MREASSAENSTSLDERARERHRLDRLAQAVLGSDLELPLEVEGGRGQEGVDHRVAGALERLAAGLDVLRPAAAERRDLGALHRVGDRLDRLEIPGGGDREAALDDVDAELFELERHAHLLGRVHAAARRLLAVAQRRVEDRDPVAHRTAPTGLSEALRTSPSAVTSTASRNGIIERSCAPTCSSFWLRSAVRVCVELRPAGLVLGHPALRVLAALDLVEHPLHLLLRLLGHDARARRVVAVLGGVAHRVAHVVEPAAVHQVDDQLQLVHALEVRDLRLVAGLHQRLEAGLDERRRAAAEHGLLAEEIGLGLLGEAGLDHARAGAADSLRVGESHGLGLAARVLVHGQQTRRALAFLEHLAHAVAGSLGRDHRDVDARGRRDRAEADVEAVREHQRVARLEARARSPP